MYKAIQAQTGEEIISLSPEWRGRLPDLRALDRRDLLVCQSCRQPMRLKAGRRRRPHFAHKHLKGCSYGSVSPAVLEARGALYERLAELFPGVVEVEKDLPGSGLPRAVDLWVDAPQGQFAIWVVDAVLKLEAREAILQVLSGENRRVIWVMCARLLRPEHSSPTRVRLSPSERAFLSATPFDEVGRESRLDGKDFGESLHYLDAEAGMLTTYRSLERVHAPNIYSGRRLISPLAQVRVNPLAPDLTHPGEEAQLSASRAERHRRGERIRRFLKPDAEAQPAGAGEGWLSAHSGRSAEESRRFWRSDEPKTDNQAAVCVHCGQVTTDWWQAWWEGDARRCKCRTCLEKGLE